MSHGPTVIQTGSVYWMSQHIHPCIIIISPCHQPDYSEILPQLVGTGLAWLLGACLTLGRDSYFIVNVLERDSCIEMFPTELPSALR